MCLLVLCECTLYRGSRACCFESNLKLAAWYSISAAKRMGAWLSFLLVPLIPSWERTYFCKLSLSNFTSIQKCNSKDQSVCGFITIMQLRSSYTSWCPVPKGSLVFLATNNSTPLSRRKQTAQTLRSSMRAIRGDLGFSACVEDRFALMMRGGAEAWQK